eukprot:6176569-Pleurochrysis_carterae.AAC.3
MSRLHLTGASKSIFGARAGTGTGAASSWKSGRGSAHCRGSCMQHIEAVALQILQAIVNCMLVYAMS